jgi:hypothetical protein
MQAVLSKGEQMKALSARTQRKVIAAMAVALVAVGLPAGVAAAAPTGPVSRYQADTVAAVIATNPGARQIAPGTVELAKGGRIIVPVKPDAILGCSNGWLCVNEHENYSGQVATWQSCGFVELANVGYSGGGTWQDRISSIRNGQTNGVIARFYDYNGAGQPIELASLRADNALNNVGTLNDRIDRILVCPGG